MGERSIVLIDAQNVLIPWFKYCEEKGLNEKIDYNKLVQHLSKDTNLLRAYFYDGVPENITVKKKNFLDAIQKRGIQLKTKILRKRDFKCEHCDIVSSRHQQKGVDVSLATDILRHAFQQTCEICIVVSGDEDYKDAIEVAKDRGIKVWVASFKNALSSEVEKTADKVILLDDIFHNIKKTR